LVFADDSGLVVDALDGAPGVYSARYSGIDATDEANNALVLERLRGTTAEKRTARFVCCIALAQGNDILRTFSGEVEGRLLEELVGSGGFGYDPLFFFDPLGKTLAEVTPEEKWQYSHRGQAFRKMLAWLKG
jgi:XTP/dITP diphosphohydrolase